MQLDTLPTLFRTQGWRLSLLHAEPVHRLFWLTAGQARCILGGRLRGTGVHACLLVPAGSLFALEPGAALSGLLLRVPDAPTLSPTWPAEPLMLRIRDALPQAELTGLLDAINQENIAKRPHFVQAMRSYLPLLSIWLHRQLPDPAHAPDPDKPADLICRAFLSELEARFATGAAVAEYAATLGITATHLSRVCKARTGQTAAELSAARVLHAARSLLETTNRPAKDIAAGLGFGSGAAFSRFVQTRTGASPRALRKTARQTQTRGSPR